MDNSLAGTLPQQWSLMGRLITLWGAIALRRFTSCSDASFCHGSEGLSEPSALHPADLCDGVGGVQGLVLELPYWVVAAAVERHGQPDYNVRGAAAPKASQPPLLRTQQEGVLLLCFRLTADFDWARAGTCPRTP